MLDHKNDIDEFEMLLNNKRELACIIACRAQ